MIVYNEALLYSAVLLMFEVKTFSDLLLNGCKLLIYSILIFYLK